MERVWFSHTELGFVLSSYLFFRSSVKTVCKTITYFSESSDPFQRLTHGMKNQPSLNTFDMFFCQKKESLIINKAIIISVS